MKLGSAACLTAIALSGAAAAVDATAPQAVVFTDGAVQAPLTTTAGDAEQGRVWFADRKLGNCLACHQNADLTEAGFHGEVGPPLDGVADRWEEPELRGIVINSKQMFEGTIMPSFYKDAGYTRPLGKFEGKTILSAQQVEDIVAYLMTLKDE